MRRLKNTAVHGLLSILLLAQPSRSADEKPGGKGSLVAAEKELVREEGLVANFYCGQPDGAQPVILLLGGSNGGLPVHGTNKKAIDTLVNSGYSVLATAYFKEEGLPQTLRSVPLEFFDKALLWLRKHSKVKKGRVAVIGISKGGELALLLASRHPEIKAVVGIVPPAYVFQGIARRYHTNSSWSYEGKDLPYVPYKMNLTFFKAVMTSKFYNVYKQALENTEASEKARISVEKINGPILLLSGKKDQMWPSTSMCDDIIKMLKEKGFPFFHEHVAYDSGHGVGAQARTWKKVVDFLANNYK